jgi:hypothetical protein
MVDLARDPACSVLGERTNQLLTDAVLRRRFGEAGRKRAAEYDWSTVTGKVIDLYDRLLSGAIGGTEPLLPPGHERTRTL